MHDLIIIGCLGVLAAMAILFFIFRVMAPYMTSTNIASFVSRIPCANCDDTVHGCTHMAGVRSTWVHDSTGRTPCLDNEGNRTGTNAYHG